MALDTIAIQIPRSAVNEYLNKLDERGETYCFAVSGLPLAPSLSLSLHRDGTSDPLEVQLNADGTWTCTHVLLVGEKD